MLAGKLLLFLAIIAAVHGGGSEEWVAHEHNDEMGPIFMEEEPEHNESENEDDLEVFFFFVFPAFYNKE